jgi:sugar lactone lactonase YvrE
MLKYIAKSFHCSMVLAVALSSAGCSNDRLTQPAIGGVSNAYSSLMDVKDHSRPSMWLSGGSYMYEGSKAVYFGIVNAYTLHGKNHRRGVLWGPNKKDLVSPQGMVTDPNGNLYVVDGGASGASAIYMYSPGAKTPSKTLSDAGMFPVQVAIGANGTLYVANMYTASFGPGNIVAYAPGASSPTKTYTDSNFDQVEGVAVDRHGNIFVSYNFSPSSTGTVAVFLRGSENATETGIKVPQNGSSSEAGVLALDIMGNLLLGYGADSGGVAAYSSSAPYTQKGQFNLNGHSQGLAFDRDGKTLYSADYQLSQGEVYSYDPSTFSVSLINTVSPWFPKLPSYLGDARGIAVAPALALPK